MAHVGTDIPQPRWAAPIRERITNRRAGVLGVGLLVTALALAMPPGAAGEVGPDGFAVYPGTQPTKVASSAEVTAGGTIQWTITVYNDAPGADEASIDITDDVPDPADGLPVAPWSLADIISQPPGSFASYGGDYLSVSGIVVPKGGSASLVFQTTVLPTAPDGTQICNQAWLRYTLFICTGSPPLCADQVYESGTRPPGDTAPAKTCVTVRAPATGPDVTSELATTSTADSCPGNSSYPNAGDGVFSPGETVTLTLAVQNTGQSDARANPAPIQGTINPGPGFTVVQGSSAYATTGRRDVLQALGANVGTNTTPFVIRIDPAVACPTTISIELVVSQIDGGPYTVRYDLAVNACSPTCRAVTISAASSASARDVCASVPGQNNGNIEPGEDAFLTLPVTNSGTEIWQGDPTITGRILIAPAVAGITLITGRDSSDYPDIAAGATESNLVEFGVHVAETVPCGTAFNIRLDLTGAETEDHSVTYPFSVESPCTVCAASACSVTAAAAAAGPARYCVGGSVTLDAAGSVLSSCTGVALYQWYQGTTAIPGATASTYDTPTTLTPGSYSYSVEVSCSTQPTCSDRSTSVAVTVDAVPLVVRALMGVRSARDVVLSWASESTATGGYHIYRAATDKTLIPVSRDVPPPGVSLAGSTPDATTTTLTLTGDVDGLPANPNLFFYQTVSVCSDGATEGPN